MSKIEWTERTWNPTTGCDKVSPGCDNCYAERESIRLRGMGLAKYQRGFEVALHPYTLAQPAKWKKTGEIVFVNSMSDLHHPEIPQQYVVDIYNKMEEYPVHTFQVLTKRPKSALFFYQHHWRREIPPNVWIGVSVENRLERRRINVLREIPAAIRFLSCEPLLEDLGELNLEGIHWVIVGGESGPRARPMKVEWVRNIRDQCVGKGVKFHFKQWGGVNKNATGRTIDGAEWDERPDRHERRLM